MELTLLEVGKIERLEFLESESFAYLPTEQDIEEPCGVSLSETRGSMQQ